MTSGKGYNDKLINDWKTRQMTEWSYGNDHLWSAKGFSVWPLCDLTSFFDLQSFFMMAVLLLLLYENGHFTTYTVLSYEAL